MSASLVVALALAVVHIFSGRLRFLEGTPRSIWLSTAGGVSVAYVFVHILPDLAKSQEAFQGGEERWMTGLERHVWLLALVGLASFYGLERMVRSFRCGQIGSGEPCGVFWIHTASFAIYNMLFGYLLLHREEGGLKQLVLLGVAIGLHFVVNDFGLRLDHRQAWDRIARWLLAAAILAGWVLGWWMDIHDVGVAAIFGLLAGGIVLNVLKEELPEDRQSRFWAFALGAAGYAALLLVAG